MTDSERVSLLKRFVNEFAFEKHRLDEYYDEVIKSASNDIEDDFELINKAYIEYDIYINEMEETYLGKILQLFGTHQNSILRSVG